jgi:hypothetical protein
MTSKNITKHKSFDFAIAIVKLYQYLTTEKRNTLFQNRYYEAAQV